MACNTPTGLGTLRRPRGLGVAARMRRTPGVASRPSVLDRAARAGGICKRRIATVTRYATLSPAVRPPPGDPRARRAEDRPGRRRARRRARWTSLVVIRP